jgi:hypothetical protein
MNQGTEIGVVEIDGVGFDPSHAYQGGHEMVASVCAVLEYANSPLVLAIEQCETSSLGNLGLSDPT